MPGRRDSRVANLVPLSVAFGPEPDDDAADERPHVGHIEPREHGFDRAHEHRREPRAITAFERELTVMDNDRGKVGGHGVARRTAK